MTEPDRVDQALSPVREAAASLVVTVAQAAVQLMPQRVPATAIAAGLNGLTLMRERASELVDLIDHASSRLAQLKQELYDPRRFDPERWPERQQAISWELQAHPLDGASSWLAAWACAFLTGCPAEADRLVTEPFPLPAEAAWCPDRFGVAADALQARSVSRLAPILTYLADGGPLGGRALVPADVRARAAVLHGRLVLQAGPDGVAELLDRAEQLAGGDDAEVLAARAALARMHNADAAAGGPGQLDAAAGGLGQLDAAAGGPGQLDAAPLARRAWEAERCPAAAVEYLYAEHGGDGRTPDALAGARHLIGELPFPAGRLEGMFDVLIQPVPDPLWAAAAEGAAAESDFDSARRLADRVRADAAPLLLADVADLRVRIAEQSGQDDAAVADLLDAAGLAALGAEQPKRAIDAYERALARVGDHQNAALHLADALLSDGWGKPLRQAEPNLRRAQGLLAAEWSRRPLTAETSWSLLTESYLHTLLAAGVIPDVRAAELWRAPLAAARAIAFDPSDGRAWGRLADCLTNLKCRRAALILGDHAARLAPDDPSVRDVRLVALSNLGRVEAALPVLAQAEQQTPGPWYCAVRGFLLRLSAIERRDEAPVLLKDALKAADEAVRGQPDGTWPHQVRAELLLDLGAKDQAREEFEYLWREARLDEADGLIQASWAAAELGLGPDAVSLSEQAVALAVATVEDGEEYTCRGLSRILEGDRDGLSDLATATALTSTRAGILDLGARITRLTADLAARGSAVDLGDVTAAISARADQIAAYDAQPPLALVGAEFDRVSVNRHYDPDVSRAAALAAALARAFTLIAAGDPAGATALGELAAQHPEYPELASAVRVIGAAVTASPAESGPPAAAPEAEVEIFVPPSWFAGLPEPNDHEIIKRFAPDVRARVRRSLGATLPSVSFKDDTSLEPARFRIRLRGTVTDEGKVSLDRWYVPDGLRSALSEPVQAALQPPADVAGLYSFPAPASADSLTALVAWPAPEVVMRQLEQAYTIDRAVAAGNLAAAEAGYRAMLDVRERQLGGDDPATMAARLDLATVLQQEGKLREAADQLRGLADAQARVKGPDDLATLIVRQQLANVLSDEGQFTDSETEQRGILEVCERLFGDDNPTTLAVRYGLAGVLKRQGRLTDAEAEYRVALDGQTRVEGADEPDTLNTREQLALVLAGQTRLPEAETEQRAVLAARQRVLGDDHPDTVSARYELAGMLRQQGRPADAEAEYRAALAAQTRIKGADHPDTLVTRRQLAAVLAGQDRLDEAEAELRTMAADAGGRFGGDSIITLVVRYDLAGVLRRQRRLDEAEAEYQAVLDATIRVKGPDDPETQTVRQQLAAVQAERADTA
jgi:Tetratricopeptide repeat